MWKNLLLLSLVLILGNPAIGQNPPETDQEFEESYNHRIQQEYIYNVYIPKDLTDAFIQLNKLIDAGSKEKFKTASEEEAVHKLYFSLGRWISYNWGFYEGSRLSHYLKGLGIYNPDDMSEFIIITYHRNLNRKPLDVKALIQTFQDKQKKEEEERLKKGKVIYEEKHKRKDAPKGKSTPPVKKN